MPLTAHGIVCSAVPIISKEYIDLKNINFFINNTKEIIPTVNDSPYKRILVIGDVHASFDKLISLWKKLSVTDEDLIIFFMEEAKKISKRCNGSLNTRNRKI